ncbi:MAG TPA: protein-L-isoaspartate(D-aspartate) O-methyltransferase [Burkholderiales bacterium]|nr:protein-L-isoaspartate(D-aspartate) O-methyltransferase [Burkholderiales bacterium]
MASMRYRGLRSLSACLALAVSTAALADEATEFTEMRRALADAIEQGVNRMRQRTGAPAIDPRVIEAMAKVPRHEFTPPPLRPYAYLDRPLPVGPDATISQPSLVAVMTDLLKIERGQKVLEVGVGGGYHTAVLAEMTPEVMSVEFHPNVAAAARKILERLGYGAVKVNVADGYYGWRPGAPYDAILVRMAIPDVSSALLEQLKPGGRLIAPVGPDTGPQQLIVFQKGADGSVTETSIMEVIFRSLPGGTRL